MRRLKKVGARILGATMATGAILASGLLGTATAFADTTEGDLVIGPDGNNYESNVDQLWEESVQAIVAELAAMESGPSNRDGDVGTISGPFASNEGPNANLGSSSYFSWAEYSPATPNGHTLGAFVIDGKYQWCRDFSTGFPVGDGTITQNIVPVPAAQAIMKPTNPGLILDTGELGAAQMAFIMNAVIDGGTAPGADLKDSAEGYAAASVIVHANFEQTSAGQSILTKLPEALNQTGGPAATGVLERARALVTSAKENVKFDYKGQTSLTVDASKQKWTLDSIGIKSGDKYISGVETTITIDGPGVFTTTPTGTLSNGNKTWKGKTSDKGLHFEGVSTGNGTITANFAWGTIPVPSLEEHARPEGFQNTIMISPTKYNVPVKPDTETGDVVYDFKPMLISNVEDVDSKAIAKGETKISDSVKVFADPAYKNVNNDKFQGQWLGVGATYPGQDGYKPLPVTFTGKAYKIPGELPTGVVESIPSGSVVVAEAEITTGDTPDGCDYTSAKPCEFKVSEDLNDKWDGKPGFVVWEWKMEKSNQPKVAKDDLRLIASDWKDKFGIAEEQTVLQWEGKIESNIKINPTNNNTYLVDDLWITELPKDYPTFEGGYGFAADTKTVSQSLYFWADKYGDEVNSIDDAELIASIDVPAKNGFYPSLGDLDFKLQRDEDGNLLNGTYQFVHELKAPENGRVQSFISEIPDESEQFVVQEGEIEVWSKATGDVEDLTLAAPKATITDNFFYKGLDPSKEYRLEASLVLRDSGEPVKDKDGKPIVKTVMFTPEAIQRAKTVEGVVVVEFEFDATDLAGKTVVVFEKLYLGDELIAEDASVDHETQTIFIPELQTTATGEEGEKEIAPEPTKLIDKVCYTGLSPNKEYELKGKLMDKSTNKPLLIDGKEVTSELTFTPEKSDGCVEMVFEFDASKLKGQEIVVFEDMFREDVLVGTHHDITDKGQTVKVKKPTIGTTATSPNGGKEIDPTKDVVINDKVCYTDLTPGKEYELKGKLMDKSTNKPLVVNGKEVTSSLKFTPKEAKGCVEMSFKFDASGLAGKDIVVFEYLYQNGKEVTTHTDINDKGQTIHVRTPLAKTGANGALVLGAVGGALVLGAGALTLVLRRKNKGLGI